MRPFCVLLALAALGASTAQALVTMGDDPASLMAPANGAPWDHVAQVSGSASGVYLGNGFLLTAGHVNVDTSTTASMQVLLNNVRYNLDRTYGNQGEQRLAGVDLKVLKLAGDPGLPALELTLPNEVDYGKSSVVIGWGAGKGALVQDVGWEWGDHTTEFLRWGTNVTSNYIFNYQGSKFLEALFDRGMGDSEAHLAIGDSGCGLFQLSAGGIWKLAGVGDLSSGRAYYDYDLRTPGDQPDAAYYLRVATYRDQILFATGVPEPATGLLFTLGAAIPALFPWRRRGRRSPVQPS